MKLILLIIFVTAIIALLIYGQHKMIYHPRPYSAHEAVPDICRALEYTTGQGKQVSYYLPPAEKDKEPPERLWIMFGGNASLALEWLELIHNFPDRRAGFLLLEYPGYGRCQGRAGPESIMESAVAALSTLASYLKADEELLKGRLNLIGHSLGCATALLYGSRNPAERVVLISPFTSLRDMASLVVGKPLDRTLFHNFDNRARLRDLLANPAPPIISIIHGDHDKIVPVRMGRELAAINPAIRYFEEKNGDHNYVLVTAKKEIIAAMTMRSSGQKIDEPWRYKAELSSSSARTKLIPAG